MAEKSKLVRRTITEEVYESPDLDAEIEDTDEDDVEDDSPRKRKHR